MSVGEAARSSSPDSPRARLVPGAPLAPLKSMKQLLAIVCVSFGCVSPDAPEQSAAEQTLWNGGPDDPNGEVIVIEGGWDSCLDGHVCWGDLDEDPIDPGDTGGYAGGGGPGGGPGRKPDRKICSNMEQYPSVEECKQCCLYNNMYVDGWDCNRAPKSKKRECWEKANQVMAACNRKCEWDRGVITTGQWNPL